MPKELKEIASKELKDVNNVSPRKEGNRKIKAKRFNNWNKKSLEGLKGRSDQAEDQKQAK
jgi:hypothetical protein